MTERSAIARTADDLLSINFSVNGLASILTLALMRYMWKVGRLKLNLYTKCVAHMTLLQAFYDVSTPLYFYSVTEIPFVEAAARGYSSTFNVVVVFMVVFCGVGASLWSLMLLGSALFTVQYGRQPSRTEQMVATACAYLLMLSAAIPAAVICHQSFYDVSRASEHFDYWRNYDIIRITLIVLSFIVLVRLYQFMLNMSLPGERHKSPLYHLIRKIMWYPIILSVARLGATAYKHIYNEDIATIPANADGWQVFWMYIFVLLMPLNGSGCLIAFLHVTAKSKRSLVQMLHLECIFHVPDEYVPRLNQDHKLGHIETTNQGMHDRYVSMEERYMSMDEHELASVVAKSARASSVAAGGMSENEQGIAEERSGTKTSPEVLHEI